MSLHSIYPFSYPFPEEPTEHPRDYELHQIKNQLLKTSKQVLSKPLEMHVDEFSTLNFVYGFFYGWITLRPHYCDRGRFQLNVNSKNSSVATIDAADGFPRYYFLMDSLLAESMYFLLEREQSLTDKNIGVRV